MKGSDVTPQLSEEVKGNLLAFKTAKEEAAAVLTDLTPMQRQYCEARLSGMIPLHAAKHAGYAIPDVNAYRLEKHPAIQRALTNARRMVIERFDLSRNDVIRGMMDAVQASGNATELVSAWREIGRIIGVYEPSKVEVTHKIEDVTLERLQSMSTKDLIELAEGRDFEVLREEDPFEDDYKSVQDALRKPKHPALYRGRKDYGGTPFADELDGAATDTDPELGSDERRPGEGEDVSGVRHDLPE